MNLVPWMLPISLALALLLGWLLRPLVRLDDAPRDHGIDALRGFLAPLVMLHHASVWRSYLSGRDWLPPSPGVFHHAGGGSVILFFMITGFLFWRKVLRSKPGTIDWKALYVSRFFRLTPLYASVVATLLLLVFASTGFRAAHPPGTIAWGAFRWFTFTILGTPDVNGLVHTKLIVANVTWSLRFEWFFYCVLPLLAFLAGRRPRLPWLLLGVAVAAAGFQQRLDIPRCSAFLGGIAAAFLQERLSSCLWVRGIPGSTLLLATLAAAVTVSSDPFSPTSLVLYGASFALIASGASLFGLLRLRGAMVLGEISYSIYLVHGVVLWSLVRWSGAARAAIVGDEWRYWLAVQGVLVCVILVSCATWRWIEVPGISLGRRLAARPRISPSDASGASPSRPTS